MFAKSWLLFAALPLFGCREAVHSHDWWAMNCNMSVSIYGKSPRPPELVFGHVEVETERMAAILTDFSDHSPLSQVTGIAGDTLPIKPEIESILNEGLEIAQASHGGFDLTLHDLKMLWGLGDGQKGDVPDSMALDSLMAENPAYHATWLGDSAPPQPITLLPGHRVRLNRSHTRLDLGAIAKGHIVDKLHALLDSLGCPNHLIQAGGEIRCGGKKQDKPWMIGIRHPRISDSLAGMIRSSGPLSVSTSGDYERYFFKDGKRYHHIFNPRTGYPAESSIAVTVVADSGLLTDALSTALFVLGPEKGMAIARKFGAKAVWFEQAGKDDDAVCARVMPELASILALRDIPACR